MVFREATNGFRAEWGAGTYAAFRSVVSTEKLTGNTVLDAIAATLAPATALPR